MNMEKDKLEELKLLSAKIRKDVLEMLEKRGYGHMGGSLSIVELMSVLYGKQLRYDAKNPDWEERDMVVLSKGHSGPAWYSVLAEKGFFDREWLFTLNDGGTKLPSHPDRLKTPGVDMTTGSLGQGTSAAAGIATGFKMNKTDQYVYLIVGDGELNEGQCWEAFQYIAHYKLKGSTYSSFVNRRGVFLIGDSVAHAPVYKALEEYFGSGISLYGNNEATNEKNDINLAESKYQIPGGDYVKVRAIPRFIELQTIENKNYLSLGFDYLSQKKKVLWKKHRTMIILRLTASGSGSGFEVYNVSIKNYQNKNGVTILLHTDVYNKLLAKDQGGMLGHVGENPRNSVTIVTPPRFEFSGRMEIWSDEMPESNKGTAKISLKEDW